MSTLTRVDAIVAASVAAEAVYECLHQGPTLTVWWRVLTHSTLKLDDLAALVEANPNVDARELLDKFKCIGGGATMAWDGNPLEAALLVFQASLLTMLNMRHMGAAELPLPPHRQPPQGAAETPDAADEPTPEAAPADANVSPRPAASAFRTCATEVASRMRRHRASEE